MFDRDEEVNGEPQSDTLTTVSTLLNILAVVPMIATLCVTQSSGLYLVLVGLVLLCWTPDLVLTIKSKYTTMFWMATTVLLYALWLTIFVTKAIVYFGW